jgi:hypothetical protein
LAYVAVQFLAKMVNSIPATLHTASPAKLPFPASTALVFGILFALVAVIVMAKGLSKHKQTTEAWAKGARGEQVVAQRLARDLPNGVVLIHDRTVPGGRANIDHIAVGPAGIFILDAKNMSGRVEARSTGPIWNRGPVKLFVRGRDRSQLIDGMQWQVAAVQMALGNLIESYGVKINPMIVFVGAQWGVFTRPMSIRGVWVGWPKKAAEVVGQRGPLPLETIRRISATLVDRLPPA